MGVFVDRLRKDHENIRLIGNIAKQFCKKINRGEQVRSEDIDHMIEFLDIYSFRGHHEMMETGLSNALKEARRLNNAKSTEVFAQDHVILRMHFKKIKERYSKLKEKDRQGLSGLIRYTLNFLDFLNRHLEKEDQAFYPLADQMLSGEVQTDLLKRFTSQASEVIGQGKLETFRNKLSQLSVQSLKVG